MPGVFFAFMAKDKETRPFEQRGFMEVEPVAPYANQSEANERNIKIKKDGSDPVQGYPERQKKSPDAPGRK